MNNISEEALRINLYQFIGGVLASYTDPEQAISIIVEELVKVISSNEENTEFENYSMRPLIKSVQYIISQRYIKNKELLEQAFTEVPIPVELQRVLNEDKQLLDLLDKYIKKLQVRK